MSHASPPASTPREVPADCPLRSAVSPQVQVATVGNISIVEFTPPNSPCPRSQCHSSCSVPFIQHSFGVSEVLSSVIAASVWRFTLCFKVFHCKFADGCRRTPAGRLDGASSVGLACVMHPLPRSPRRAEGHGDLAFRVFLTVPEVRTVGVDASPSGRSAVSKVLPVHAAVMPDRQGTHARTSINHAVFDLF